MADKNKLKRLARELMACVGSLSYMGARTAMEKGLTLTILPAERDALVAAGWDVSTTEPERVKFIVMPDGTTQ